MLIEPLASRSSWTNAASASSVAVPNASCMAWNSADPIAPSPSVSHNSTMDSAAGWKGNSANAIHIVWRALSAGGHSLMVRDAITFAPKIL